MPSCPVCNSPESQELHTRLRVPILMNRVYATVDEARSAKLGDVHMFGCSACGFAWNAAFDENLIVYDENYENDQGHSPAFSSHVHERARDIVASIPTDENVDFLEVGCGQGGFIALVASEAGDRLGGVEGFDPAWRGKDGEGPAGSRIHKAFFTPQTAALCQRPPKAVASRHTIEHIANPVAFLTTIRNAMRAVDSEDRPRRLFIETPCIDWIVKNEAIQDFFYEHCSLFSAYSLALALKRAGFHQPNVQHVFGRQYLWAEAVTQPIAEMPEISNPVTMAHLGRTRDGFAASWSDRIEAAANHGHVALWGAGAKGVTFALMVDPSATKIDHVVDINPAKQKHFLAGTGLPILSPMEAAERVPKTIFVMNPNYFSEIEATCKAVGINANIVAIN
jgi:hypothetical protein